MPKMSKGKVRVAAKPFEPKQRPRAKVPGTKDRGREVKLPPKRRQARDT